MRGFVIHLGIFVVVVGLLAALHLYEIRTISGSFGCLPAGVSGLPPSTWPCCSSGRGSAKRSSPIRRWYVIADGGRARFVERDEEGAFRTLSSFVTRAFGWS
jgi:hypothetical protein